MDYRPRESIHKYQGDVGKGTFSSVKQARRIEDRLESRFKPGPESIIRV